MTHYTDEQIMIRAMPCPKCFAQPRELCNRKAQENGIVRNHRERMELFHDHVAQVNSGLMWFETYHVATTQKAFDEMQSYDEPS
tara:strand:+ start:445 stop:696 length:252 start_codon:yes stop_codon:yes gene_type:complete